MNLLLALLGVSVAQSPTLDFRYASESVYLGRGEEAKIPGLEPDAEIYREEIVARIQLPYIAMIRPEDTARALFAQFDEQVRAYETFTGVSPFIRESFGSRVEMTGSNISPMQFMAALASAVREGRPLVSGRRLRDIALDLVDNHSVRAGVLSPCSQELRAWLVSLLDAQVPLNDARAIRAGIMEVPDDRLRTRMAARGRPGCQRSGPRDYVYLAVSATFGIGSSVADGWAILEYDFGHPAPGPLERVIPFEGIATSNHYLKGQYRLWLDPGTAGFGVQGGYDVDLGRWPERTATFANEQFLKDFTLVMFERWDGLWSIGEGG